MIRCKIFVKTQLAEEEEVARERGIRSQAKLAKESTGADLAAPAVVGEAGVEDNDFVGWSEFQNLAAQAMGTW